MPKAHAAAVSVDALLAGLGHPAMPAILALRRLLLGIDASIGEAVKWNAPSFHVGEHFATMNLRAKDGVLLVLHRGAKKTTPPIAAIPDPAGLLHWLGPDRATLVFRDESDVAAKAEALTAIVRCWITCLPAK